MSGGFASKCLGLLAASMLMITAAEAGDWRVVQSTGDVWIQSDAAQPASLSSVETIPENATLITGKTGRAMLEHDGQTLMVGPNSVATLPKNPVEGFVSVVQRAGEVEFDVDKQKVPHFAVETPFLAAVVKGTHFTVTVDDASASVSVARGLVAVSDLATGQNVDTPAGQAASVSGLDRALSVDGSAPITQGTPRAPLVAPLSGADLATMQNDAASRTPTMKPGNGGTDAAGTVVALGAAGNGGSGGGSGGASVGGSDGSGIPTFTSGSGSGTRYNTDDQNTIITPLVVAIAFAFAVTLAFGLAFLRGRFS